MRIAKRIARQRQRRQYRVRNRARRSGRPRLSVFRSNRHIYAQIIDDAAGRTLVAANSTEAGLHDGAAGNTSAAEKIGETIGRRALEAGIEQVCFDRGRYQYHGRVAALAEAARKAGLQF